MCVRGVSRRTTEAEGPCTDSVAREAGSGGICVGGPSNRTVRVGHRLGKVVRLSKVRGVLLEGVRVSAMGSVECTHDSIGHGGGIIRGKAEANRVTV